MMDWPVSLDVIEAKVNYLGYELFAGSLHELDFTGKTIINTLNQYSFCLAEKDAEFKEALQQSDVLLADGVGIVAAVKLHTDKSVPKITGYDLHSHLLKRLNQRGGRCFYLGSSMQTLQKLQQRLNADYPNISSGIYSPPFKTVFSAEENERMIQAINDFNPDVLFVGMTAPKQEKWVAENQHKIEVPTICAIGAVFDFYAGTVKRPNKIWIKLNLEWFGRLLNEPKRLWKRYLYYGPIFLFLLIKYKLSFLFS